MFLFVVSLLKFYNAPTATFKFSLDHHSYLKCFFTHALFLQNLYFLSWNSLTSPLLLADCTAVDINPPKAKHLTHILFYQLLAFKINLNILMICQLLPNQYPTSMQNIFANIS